MKKINILIIMFSALVFLLTGCDNTAGGGFIGGSSGGGNTQNNSSSASGIAQLGYIKDAKVELYKLSNLDKSIATTKTSGSINTSDAGSFTFDKVSLDDNQYYLVKISNGQDIDANDDGVVDDTYTDVNGSVYTLAKGSSLKSGDVRINALTDMAYQKLKGNLSSLSSSQIDTKLTETAREYLYDIDGDGVVSQKDLLEFDPTKNRDKTKKSYKDILDIYVSKLHSGADEDEKLASLMYLDNPRIVVKNGALQEVPFNLEVSIENKPEDTTVKWYLNNVEKTSINEQITDDGAYLVIAKIYKDAKLLKTISSRVIATKKVEIASIDVDISKDNIVFVTDDSNSSLAGAKITIPKGALKTNTKITIKKSSMNTIPNTDGISISDVIVMEPSGLKFDKPVQIRIPYNENVDIENQNIRIARYSDGGKIDYIEPLFVDKDTHEVVFETEHFTEFKAETTMPFSTLAKWTTFNDTEDEKFINALNQEFPGYGYDIDDWKPILNVFIDKEIKKLTVYDYLITYFQDKKMFNIIKNGTTSDRYHAEALSALFPNIIASSRNYQMWKDIENGFKTIELLQSVGSSIMNISNGKVYTDLLNKLGVPTSASDVSFYSPTSVANFIIKDIGKSNNENYLKNYFENQDLFYNENGRFIYEGATLDTELNYFKENNMMWQVESFIRRYKNFNPTKDLQKTKNIIDSAIAYLKNQKELDKAKKNQTQTFHEKSGSISYKENEIIHIEYSMDLKGYDRDLDLNIQTNDPYGKELITKKRSTCEIDDNLDSINRTCTGHMYLDSKLLQDNNSIILKAYKSNTFVDDYLDTDLHVYLRKINKQQVKVTGLSMNGELNSNGDFEVDLEGTFDIGSLAHTIEVELPNHTEYTKHFVIPSSDFKNTALSNVRVLVKPSADVLKSYEISPTYKTVNIKAKIDRALAGTIDNTLPSVKIIKVNGVSVPETNQHDAQSIDVGDSVTYSIDGSNLKYIFTGGLSCSVKSSDLISTNQIYRCTYDTPNVYKPYVRVVLKNANDIQKINAPTVSVMEVGNMIPTINLPQDTQVYEANEKIYLNAEVSDDDGYIISTKWTPVYNNLAIINSNSATGAYVVAPTITDNELEYKFKVTTTDNQGAQNTAMRVVKVHGDTSIKRELKFVEDTTLEDSCKNSYFNSGCGYEITTGDTALKIWKFKNTGDIDFKDGLQFVLINDDSNQISLGSPRLVATSSDLSVGGEIKITVSINFENALNGEYGARWLIQDAQGNSIKMPNGNDAQMWLKIKLNRANEPTLTLSDLIVGKTLYEKCGSSVDTLIFQDNGKIKIIGDKQTDYVDYSISGNTLITNEDEDGEESHIFKDSSSKYVRFDETYGDITTIYFNKSDAQNAPDNDCGGDDHYNTEGYTYYDGKSYKILRANSYQSDQNGNPVQIYLKTYYHGDSNENGGFQLTINKYSTNQELKNALESNAEILLSNDDFQEYGLQYWIGNQPTGVYLDGTIKLVWLNHDNKFSIEQNGAKLTVNGKELTFSKTIAQWTSENNSHKDNDIKINNLVSGNVSFKDKNKIPDDAWIRITPKRYQEDGKWNGLNCKIDSNGNFGNVCYIDYDETGIREAFNNNNTKYQIVVYKNHIEPNEHHWDDGEDVYKYVGDDLDNSNWKNIIIKNEDNDDKQNLDDVNNIISSKFDENSYFPILLNKYWEYSDGTGAYVSYIDNKNGTFKIKNNNNNGLLEGNIKTTNNGYSVNYSGFSGPSFMPVANYFAFNALMYENNSLSLNFSWQDKGSSNGYTYYNKMKIIDMSYDYKTADNITYSNCIVIERKIEYPNGYNWSPYLTKVVYFIKKGIGYVAEKRFWSDGSSSNPKELISYGYK